MSLKMQERRSGYATMIETQRNGRIVIMAGNVNALKRQYEQMGGGTFFDLSKVWFVELKQLAKGGDFPAVNVQ